MESLHFGIRSGKRGSVAGHLAYITRQGKHATRDDLIETGYGNMPPWVGDNPRLLWKASNMYERLNGSTYRALTISLPSVLTTDQLIRLAWDIARRLAGNKPFQFALHISVSSLTGEIHPHLHIMLCDRLPDGIDRTPVQMFKRYNPKHPALGGCQKDSGGMTPGELTAKMRWMREVICSAINGALEANGHEMRVDHRTLTERGIDRAPERYLGPVAIQAMSDREREDFISERSQRSGFTQ